MASILGLNEAIIESTTVILDFFSTAIENTTTPPEFFTISDVARDVVNLTSESVDYTPSSVVTATFINPDDNAAKLLQETMNSIQTVMCPILLIIGILGNLSIILTVSHSQFRQMTIRYILCALAMSDSLLLMTNPFNQSFMSTIFGRDVRALSRTSCKVFFVMYRSGKMSSSWNIVFIAIERFVAVMFPLRARRILRKPLILCMLACNYVVIFSVSAFWVFATDVSNGICRPDVVTEDNRKLHKGFVILGSTLYSLAPLSILLTLTPPIIVKLVYSQRVRQKSQRHASRSGRAARETSKITLMLIGVVVSYSVWVTPITLVLILSLWTGQPIFGSTNKNLIILQGVALSFEQLNHSCNFFIYIMFSTQFRSHFIQTVLCRAGAGKQSAMRSDMATVSARVSSDSGVYKDRVCIPNLPEGGFIAAPIQ